MVPWPQMGCGTIFMCRGRWVLSDAEGIVMVCHL